jgi:hypothetical protein
MSHSTAGAGGWQWRAAAAGSSWRGCERQRGQAGSQSGEDCLFIGSLRARSSLNSSSIACMMRACSLPESVRRGRALLDRNMAIEI